VRIDLTAVSAARSLDALRITFLFAPNYHTALRHAAAARREIGVRTVFNVLGPLTNPAGARRQLLGVYDDALVVRVAEVLRELGSERAWVVHGRDELDELTLFAKSHVAELDGGKSASSRSIQELALRTPIAPGRSGDAAATPRRSGGARGEKGPARDIVVPAAARRCGRGGARPASRGHHARRRVTARPGREKPWSWLRPRLRPHGGPGRGHMLSRMRPSGAPWRR
jgi:anthranilate phosphoribosyltransferase